jgi:ferredoxin, 2Fe-2S
MDVIKVHEPNGQTHVLDAAKGWRVMEVIRLYGLPVEHLDRLEVILPGASA